MYVTRLRIFWHSWGVWREIFVKIYNWNINHNHYIRYNFHSERPIKYVYLTWRPQYFVVYIWAPGRGTFKKTHMWETAPTSPTNHKFSCDKTIIKDTKTNAVFSFISWVALGGFSWKLIPDVSHTLCTCVVRFIAIDQQLRQLYLNAVVYFCLYIGSQWRGVWGNEYLEHYTPHKSYVSLQFDNIYRPSTWTTKYFLSCISTLNGGIVMKIHIWDPTLPPYML